MNESAEFLRNKRRFLFIFTRNHIYMQIFKGKKFEDSDREQGMPMYTLAPSY